MVILKRNLEEKFRRKNVKAEGAWIMGRESKGGQSGWAQERRRKEHWDTQETKAREGRNVVGVRARRERTHHPPAEPPHRRASQQPESPETTRGPPKTNKNNKETHQNMFNSFRSSTRDQPTQRRENFPSEGKISFLAAVPPENASETISIPLYFLWNAVWFWSIFEGNAGEKGKIPFWRELFPSLFGLILCLFLMLRCGTQFKQKTVLWGAACAKWRYS